MSPDELIPVRVVLGERSYSLKIPRSEEVYVRAAAQLMQRKLQELKKQYSPQDDQDAIALVTLDVATDLTRLSAHRNEGDEALEAVVNKMESLLNIV